MSLDPNKTYLVWNGTEFPNSANAAFKAPAGSTIDWGDGTVETFATASTTVNTHTYTDGKTEHTIAISGLTSISTSAFMYCTSLTNITIGNSVTIIDYQAFYRCSGLTSITIPNSVTSIGNQSFRHCTMLTSVTSIEARVFQNCTKLTQLILFPSTPPTLGSEAIPANVQSIYVQQSSKAAYQAATNWTTFASKIVSDNIYLSFVRFNQKNKEYINGKVGDLQTKINGKLTAPTTPTADSVITLLADGMVGTKPLSEFVPKKTTTGTYVYTHNGETQGEMEVKSAITPSDNEIPTSNGVISMVNTLIANKQDKIDVEVPTHVDADINLTLENNKEFRYGNLFGALNISFPSNPELDFMCELDIQSLPSMSYPNNIKWSGDDIENGVFVPDSQAVTHYQILFYTSGVSNNIWNGIVRKPSV